MGEVGSQTLGTFVIGQNAVNTSIVANGLVSSSVAKTTGNALEQKLNLGEFSISERPLGTLLTKSPFNIISPRATVSTSSKSESIVSKSTIFTSYTHPHRVGRSFIFCI